MISVNLTDDERKKLIEETNNLIHEENILKIDIYSLKEQMNRIGFVNRYMSPDNKELYRLMETRVFNKSRRLLVVLKEIETNKKILELDKNNKKNKTL